MTVGRVKNIIASATRHVGYNKAMYRRLNAVTRKDAYPLPRTQECLDTVSGASQFSTFDRTAGYHQVLIRNEDISKTAFGTKYGLYEFKTMPFGLRNSPANFQRLMDLVLHGLLWQTCLIYLDAVIVYASTFDEHIRRVDDVLRRIKEAGLKLKPEKCQLLRPHVTESCQNALEKLKATLVGPEVMRYPRDEGGYMLDIGASHVGIGAVLSQVQDGRERVIAYGNKTLSKCESNYCIPVKEFLAVKYFMEHYRQYLLGR